LFLFLRAHTRYTTNKCRLISPLAERIRSGSVMVSGNWQKMKAQNCAARKRVEFTYLATTLIVNCNHEIRFAERSSFIRSIFVSLSLQRYYIVICFSFIVLKFVFDSSELFKSDFLASVIVRHLIFYMARFNI